MTPPVLTGTPPTLRTGEPPAADPIAPAAFDIGWPELTIALGALALIVIVAVIALRRRDAMPRDERAFRAMARRLRLSRADRRAVRALAAVHDGVAPVALLVSPDAAEIAVERASNLGKNGALPPEDLDRIRARLLTPAG